MAKIRRPARLGWVEAPGWIDGTLNGVTIAVDEGDRPLSQRWIGVDRHTAGGFVVETSLGGAVLRVPAADPDSVPPSGFEREVLAAAEALMGSLR